MAHVLVAPNIVVFIVVEEESERAVLQRCAMVNSVCWFHFLSWRGGLHVCERKREGEREQRGVCVCVCLCLCA